MSKIIKIYKQDCPPCVQLAKLLEEVGLEHTSIEATPEIAAEYGIRSVPVLLFYDEEGQETDRLLGLPTRGQLERRV